jgi:YgiT-type zinc finger domain-containing protein
MICLICRQAEIIDGLTSVNFENREMHLVINNVTARVCPSCGEAYVDEDTASQLLRIASQMSEAGVFEVECEYSDV